jgi:hypothetical protein
MATTSRDPRTIVTPDAFSVHPPLLGRPLAGPYRRGVRPVTWWHTFERAGEYAAGVATGTLGFLQIYWDPNHQAIHDKVAGTVVIWDGVPKVPRNWDRQVTDSTTQPSGGRPA